MRRSMNGTRSASNGASLAAKQSGNSPMTRRTTTTDENHAQGDKAGAGAPAKDDDTVTGLAGPVTARLKMLEKRYSQVLEMQAKFNILDKWIQQQFGIRLFPQAVVNAEKFSDGNPEDTDNPFYAVYLVVQRCKLLEEKVKKLEARPFEEFPEPKPTSNYSSANAFRNFKGGKGTGAVKRSYVSSSPTTPKKAKLISRPAPPSSTYPFKPSVKILPRDPNISSPLKKEKEQEILKESTPVKQVLDDSNAGKSDSKKDSKEKNVEAKGTETVIVVTTVVEDSGNETKGEETVKEEPQGEKMEVDDESVEKEPEITPLEEAPKTTEENTDAEESTAPPSHELVVVESTAPETVVVKEETSESTDIPAPSDKQADGDEDVAPLIEEAAADVIEEEMGDESGQEEGDMDVKPEIPLLDDELGGEVSGSEASVSSFASSSSKPRLSTRRRQAAVAAGSSTATAAVAAEKNTEEEKPVMYTARGRRHTVPRRYAEFTGHDNVVSILKSQQRAEKTAAAAGSSKSSRRQPVTPTKSQDAPPKIKKMVKSTKTPSPKKLPILTDSDGDGEPGPSKKKPGPNAVSNERPPCVDALVDRVMAREVDSDGMVVLAESYPNIYVNQQQLITVIVRSNGKSTRLTRKMTTLVFEDSVLASASPFGTKYYKDRLPPEPLEAMVDFIADSGFEPHYSKKKIYMIVGQVCNEARAGRVSRKFMQPLEATPGSSQVTSQDAPSSVPASPTPESSPP